MQEGSNARGKRCKREAMLEETMQEGNDAMGSNARG